MTPMIERVARALAAEADEDSSAPVHGVGCVWQLFVNPARAAIEAMREPTDHMAANTRNEWVDGAEAKALFRAMVDAALNEPGG